jgi:uncharacterized membrane protein
MTEYKAIAPRSKTLTLALTAMFTGLVFLFTLIQVQLIPGWPGTLIHLGNIPLFVASILFGKRTGAIAGGFGMALCDLMTGYTLWAPFSLVTGILIGWVVGRVTEKHPAPSRIFLATLAAVAIKLVGYYPADYLWYGNWITPFASFPANILQVVVGGVVALLVLKPLSAAAQKIGHGG